MTKHNTYTILKADDKSIISPAILHGGVTSRAYTTLKA